MQQTESSPVLTVANRHSDKDRSAFALGQRAFAEATIPVVDKLEAFARFAPKRSVARFLMRAEIFKQHVLHSNGAIIECGVFNGAGLFSWAQLSNIYEPSNHTRRIIGFDTFEGFPNVDARDNAGDIEWKQGDLHGSSVEQLQISIDKFNSERHLSHINNMMLVKGDFMKTAEDFLAKNTHMLISLLYLDFDLYEPTKLALELFLPRMPKGAVIAFDELNCESFPGETLAFLESIDIRTAELKRSPIDPWISYLVL